MIHLAKIDNVVKAIENISKDISNDYEKFKADKTVKNREQLLDKIRRLGILKAELNTKIKNIGLIEPTPKNKEILFLEEKIRNLEFKNYLSEIVFNVSDENITDQIRKYKRKLKVAEIENAKKYENKI